MLNKFLLRHFRGKIFLFFCNNNVISISIPRKNIHCFTCHIDHPRGDAERAQRTQLMGSAVRDHHLRAKI